MKRIILMVMLCILCVAWVFTCVFSFAEDAVAPEIAPFVTDIAAPAIEEVKAVDFFFEEYEETTAFDPVWRYRLPIEVLEDPNDLLRLVNKQNLLDDQYPPNDEIHRLVDAGVRKSSSGERLVRTVANDSLKLMFDAAEADGIRLYLHSAYRSFRTQKTVYGNRIEKDGRDTGAVQSPGASEHQTGLGVDIVSKDWIGKTLNARFAETKEARWMAANCMRFGFILRYPDGKKETTGIIFEPWHFRYVGVEAANYITEEALTLEEFTEEWHEELYSYQTQASSYGNASWTEEFTFTEDSN